MLFRSYGRNTWLYRTPNGNYFSVTRTQWQGEEDSLEPLTLDEAIDLYENSLTKHYETYEDAFPGVEIMEG